MVLIFSPCIFKRRTKQILRIVNVITHYIIMQVCCILYCIVLLLENTFPNTLVRYAKPLLCMFRLSRVGVSILIPFLFYPSRIRSITIGIQCVCRNCEKEKIILTTEYNSCRKLNRVHVYSRSRNFKYALKKNGICFVLDLDEMKKKKHSTPHTRN